MKVAKKFTQRGHTAKRKLAQNRLNFMGRIYRKVTRQRRGY